MKVYVTLIALVLVLFSVNISAYEPAQATITSEKFWRSVYPFPAKYEFNVSPHLSLFGRYGGWLSISGDEAVETIKDFGWRAGDRITIMQTAENSCYIVNESRNQCTLPAYIGRLGRGNEHGNTEWE